jgi:hypothetical protein
VLRPGVVDLSMRRIQCGEGSAHCDGDDRQHALRDTCCTFPWQLAIVLVFAVAGASIPLHKASILCGYIVVILAMEHLVYWYFEGPAHEYVRRRRL